MIIDVPRFVANERPFWDEFETLLQRVENSESGPTLGQVRRLHYLFERCASDLARLTTLTAEPEIRQYLEVLVARGYAAVHESSRAKRRFAFGPWFFGEFPRAFRRRLAAFRMAAAATVLGVAFGALVILVDPGVRDALMPFEGLRQSPTERVTQEEQTAAGVASRGTFSAYLMTHNARVAILTLAMGMTFGVGTLVLLFYNGIILGAVAADYLVAGEGVFLMGWLLPHGSIEIPAILMAGQAGLVLGGALLGRGEGVPLRGRLRAVRPDLVTLVAGAAVLLVWAGLVEAFFSQHHEPQLPYALKISFGLIEIGLLSAFLTWGGRQWQTMATGQVRVVPQPQGADRKRRGEA